MKKRILSLMLAAIMVISMLPMSAMAAPGDMIKSDFNVSIKGGIIESVSFTAGQAVENSRVSVVIIANDLVTNSWWTDDAIGAAIESQDTTIGSYMPYAIAVIPNSHGKGNGDKVELSAGDFKYFAGNSVDGSSTGEALTKLPAKDSIYEADIDGDQDSSNNKFSGEFYVIVSPANDAAASTGTTTFKVGTSGDLVVPSGKITFDANGATTGNGAANIAIPVSATAYDSAALAALTGAPTGLAKTGFKFLGWGATAGSTTADANITCDGEAFTDTVYAVWEAKSTPVAGNFEVTGTYTYTGSAQQATVVAKAGVTGMGAITITSATQTAADTYDVTISVAEGTEYKATTAVLTLTGAFAIAKAAQTLSISPTGVSTGLYVGGMQEFTITSNASADTGYALAVTSGTVATATVGTITNGKFTATAVAAGTTAITVTSGATDNYLAATNATANVTVSAAGVNNLAINGTIPANKVYGDELTVATTGGNGEAITFTPGTGLTLKSSTANSATFTVTGSTNTTLDISQPAKADGSVGTSAIAQQSITLGKRQLTWDASDFAVDTKVYDGDATATITAGKALKFGNVVTGDTNIALSTVPTVAFADKKVGASKAITVGVTSITITGTNAAHYALPAAAPTVTAGITAKALTSITGITATKVYDGTPNMQSAEITTTNAVFTGKVASDTLTVDTISAVYNNSNAHTSVNGPVTAITLGGADAANYTIETRKVTLTGSITKATPVAPTVTLTAATKVGFTLNVTAGAKYIIDTNSAAPINWTSAATATGSNEVISGKTHSTQYYVHAKMEENLNNKESTVATQNITTLAASQIIVTFNGSGNTSGTTVAQQITESTAANLTANGFVKTGYTFAGWATAAAGTTVAYADQASYTAGTSPVTLYAVWTAKAVTGTKPAAVSGKVGVAYNQAEPDITSEDATTGTVSYAITAKGTELTAAGLSFSTATGKITGTPTTAGTISGVTVTITGKNGSTSASIAYDDIVIGKGDQTATAVTVTGAGSLKYGDAVSGIAVSLDQAVKGGATVTYSVIGTNTDAVTINTATGAITAITKPGTFNIQAVIADSANYSTKTVASAAITISKKELTLAKNALTGKVSEGTAGIDLSTEGFVANPAGLKTLADAGATLSYGNITDNVDAAGTTGATISTSQITWGAEGKASFPITMATNDYYTLAAANTVTLTVTAKTPQTITFGTVPTNKTYGDSTVTVTASGGAGSGTISYTSSVPAVAAVNATTGVVTILKPGIFTITATKAEDSTYAEATVTTATITVAAKTLTYTGAVTKVYDSADTFTAADVTGGTFAGVVETDAVTIGTIVGTFADTNVHTGKTLTVTSAGTLGGAAAANYTLAVGDITITTAITAKPLTGITATTTKVYDGTTTMNETLTGTFAGMETGDNLAIASYTAAYSSKDVHVASTVNPTALTLGGTEAKNYSIPAMTDIAITQSITARPITIVATTATAGISDASIKLSTLVKLDTGLVLGAGDTIDSIFGTIGTTEIGAGTPIANDKGVKVTIQDQTSANVTALPLTEGDYTYSVDTTAITNTNYAVTCAIAGAALAVTKPSGGGGVAPVSGASFNAGVNGKLLDKDGKEVSSVNVNLKDKLPEYVPGAKAAEGYKFMGWSKDGGKTYVDPAKVEINGSASYTAIFAKYDHLPYIIGRSASSFAPEGQMTRAEATTMLARLSSGFSESGAFDKSKFPDMPADAWYAKYVSFGEKSGIVDGYDDGKFYPNKNISRGEFAALVSRFLKLNTVGLESNFTDCKGYWAEGHIEALVKQGAIDGYPDGSFKPEQTITRAEAVKTINAAIGRIPDKATAAERLAGYTNPFADVNKDLWFFYDVLEASLLHVASDFHTGK